MEEIRRLAVVGAGNMGSQVAQHLAQAGIAKEMIGIGKVMKYEWMVRFTPHETWISGSSHPDPLKDVYLAN